MLFKLSQLLKHSSPSDVTDEGIVMLVKLLQREKQLLPSDVTDEGDTNDFQTLAA